MKDLRMLQISFLTWDNPFATGFFEKQPGNKDRMTV